MNTLVYINSRRPHNGAQEGIDSPSVRSIPLELGHDASLSMEGGSEILYIWSLISSLMRRRITHTHTPSLRAFVVKGTPGYPGYACILYR